jgi:hypothetical protein
LLEETGSDMLAQLGFRLMPYSYIMSCMAKYKDRVESGEFDAALLPVMERDIAVGTICLIPIPAPIRADRKQSVLSPFQPPASFKPLQGISRPKDMPCQHPRNGESNVGLSLVKNRQPEPWKPIALPAAGIALWEPWKSAGSRSTPAATLCGTALKPGLGGKMGCEV